MRQHGDHVVAGQRRRQVVEHHVGRQRAEPLEGCRGRWLLDQFCRVAKRQVARADGHVRAHPPQHRSGRQRPARKSGVRLMPRIPRTFAMLGMRRSRSSRHRAAARPPREAQCQVRSDERLAAALGGRGNATRDQPRAFSA